MFADRHLHLGYYITDNSNQRLHVTSFNRTWNHFFVHQELLLENTEHDETFRSKKYTNLNYKKKR